MFSLLLPFSKSQQRWNEEKVKKRVQEYEKGVLMVGGESVVTEVLSYKVAGTLIF